MIHFFRNTSVVLFIFWASNAFSTQPLIDDFIYGDREGIIFPTECCWMDLPKSQKLLELRIEGQNCSAMGGPVGKFKYANGRLWLTGLRRCGGSIELNSVFPELSNPALAVWLNGNFYAKLDWLCRNEQNLYVYKTELTLEVEKGVVISLIEKHYDKSTCNIDDATSMQEILDLQEILGLMEASLRSKEQQDKAIVRPTPQERAAVQELLDMSPPPKTLIPADRKFLQELGDKVAWTGLERKRMYMMYKEVHGKEIDLSTPDKQNQN